MIQFKSQQRAHERAGVELIMLRYRQFTCLRARVQTTPVWSAVSVFEDTNSRTYGTSFQKAW